MPQWNRNCALAVVPFLALGLCAQATDDAGSPSAAGQPAAQVIKVAEHGSRWAYPRNVTPGDGQEVHIVVKGDTLWDLGTKYLGNPFAWPQIWELNKWVKDPHWIYPGDPILVESSRSIVAQSKDQNLAPDEVADLQPDIRLSPKPVLGEYAYSFPDFITMPYLVPGTAEAYFKAIGALKITGQQDVTRMQMATGDFIYLAGGSDQGVKVGDRLVVTTVAEKKFYRPDDKRHQKALGSILQQVGVVRVTEVYAAKSVAVIEKSLDGITTEGYAAPYNEPASIPLRLRTDIVSPVVEKDPVARIIFIPDTKATAGSGDMVIIDQGTEEGLNVGDILLSARSMPLDPASKTAKETTNFYVGQAMIVRTGEHNSTARILRSRYEMQVGDILTR